MTDDPNAQGGPTNADATPPDDPGVVQGGGEDGDGGQGTEQTPTGTVSTGPTAAPGEAIDEPQEGTPGAEVPDPAGIEPGETQSVPTTKGPGPEDETNG